MADQHHLPLGHRDRAAAATSSTSEVVGFLDDGDLVGVPMEYPIDVGPARTVDEGAMDQDVRALLVDRPGGAGDGPSARASAKSRVKKQRIDRKQAHHWSPEG